MTQGQPMMIEAESSGAQVYALAVERFVHSYLPVVLGWCYVINADAGWTTGWPVRVCPGLALAFAYFPFAARGARLQDCKTWLVLWKRAS